LRSRKSAPEVYKQPLILAEGGNDQIDGGAGRDTVRLGGTRAEHGVTIHRGAGSVVVMGENGQKLLTAVERVQFDDGTLALNAHDNAAQVYRLYRTALGREGEPAGIAAHTAAMDAGMSLSSIASGFVNSVEFRGKYGGLTHGDSIQLFYQNLLDRNAEPEGLAHHTAALDAGMSLSTVATSFITSPEFQIKNSALTNEATVQSLYQGILGRVGDAAGVAAHTGALDAGVNFTDVAFGFINSAEFRAKYSGLSDGDYVHRLYENVLGRAPDAQGLVAHLDALNHGASRELVLIGFSESPENQLRTASMINDGVWYA
jgi:hypothetical protein